MNKNHFTGKLLILFLFFVAGLVTIGLYGDKVEKDIVRLNISYNQYGPKVAGVAVENVTVLIDRGLGTILKFDVEAKDNTNVLSALKKVNTQYNIGLETKKYDTGELVTNLAGQKNGDGGKYWIYYINGQASVNAIDKQIIKPGDQVEFKFEKSIF